MRKKKKRTIILEAKNRECCKGEEMPMNLMSVGHRRGGLRIDHCGQNMKVTDELS